MVHYRCRHCSVDLGAVEQEIDAETLGFHRLTGAERMDMLTYHADGTIVADVICEDCHEALTRNPDLYALDNIIQ